MNEFAHGMKKCLHFLKLAFSFDKILFRQKPRLDPRNIRDKLL